MNTKGTILVSGVHAVGKSTTLQELFKSLDFPYYVASDLLANRRTKDLSQNQETIICKVQQLLTRHTFIVLDGHTTLLSNKKIWKIPMDVFERLHVNSILLIVDNPYYIQQRLWKRSKIHLSIQELTQFQNMEYAHSRDIAKQLKIPYHVFELNEIMEIKTYVQRLIKQNSSN